MTNPAPAEQRFYLISATALPLETLAAVWINSRPTQFRPFLHWLATNYNGHTSPTAEDVRLALTIKDGPLPASILVDLLQNVATMSIPVSECINFTWGWENLPVMWREQSVRKRTVGFWITSAREFGNEDFADAGRFALPPAVQDLPEQKRERATEIFYDFYRYAQQVYRKLISPEIGMTQENARYVIPSGMTHNGTMFTNLRTLMEMTAARSCWIAEVDLWSPVLQAISAELRKLHPMLGIVITPPCYKPGGTDYNGCKYEEINRNRISGRDPYMPCPIYLNHASVVDASEASRRLSSQSGPGHRHDAVWQQIADNDPKRVPYANAARRHLPIWSNIWNRDEEGKPRG